MNFFKKQKQTHRPQIIFVEKICKIYYRSLHIKLKKLRNIYILSDLFPYNLIYARH